LISAFEKLQKLTRESSRRKNWHHFNIHQRIAFLRKAQADPAVITGHRRMLWRWIAVFALGALTLFVVSLKFYSQRTDQLLTVGMLAREIRENPENAEMNRVLGLYYYQLRNWEESVRHYNRSLMAEYGQPVVLNNLAWLFLTCPDPEFRQPELALQYARDAATRDPQPFILDTLAEALWQNGHYKKAVKIAEEAFQKSEDEDRRQFRKRWMTFKRKLQNRTGKNGGNI
jgi:tetratricopeptide (TPR) repeat protein